jgi:hypothetical protein
MKQSSPPPAQVLRADALSFASVLAQSLLFIYCAGNVGVFF